MLCGLSVKFIILKAVNESSIMVRRQTTSVTAASCALELGERFVDLERLSDVRRALSLEFVTGEAANRSNTAPLDNLKTTDRRV